mgnify:FL=1
MSQGTLSPAAYPSLGARLRDYGQLLKLRLSMVVVLSAGLSYGIGLAGRPVEAQALMGLLFGGLLVTGAANAWNEIIERRRDALMGRTKDRPLPSGRMQVPEAAAVAAAASLAGVLLLLLGIDWQAAAIGAGSLVLYAAVYTPLKRHGHVAVWVGAIAGALPNAIGWYAATQSWWLEPGVLHPMPWLLFGLQVGWQFPHFHAIAWLGHADYAQAGYYLLPFGRQPGRAPAAGIVGHGLLLFFVVMAFFYLPLIHLWGAYLLLAVTALFWAGTWQLALQRTSRAARTLLFASFLYLPLALLIIWIAQR